MTRQPFNYLLQQRLSRRTLLHGVAIAGCSAPLSIAEALAVAAPRGFRPIPAGRDDRVVVPPGYRADVVIRWGDPLLPGAASLDTGTMAGGGLLTAEAAHQQARQFGAHCDAIQYFRLDAGNARQISRHGILCVNNEYTNDEQLFPGRKAVFGTDPEHVRDFVQRAPGSVAFAKAAHGISVVEIQRPEERWQYLRHSHYNRRITADTPVEIRGPARGSAWMRTGDDPAGTRVLGTLANCAGGSTPWGTYLSAEENLQDYFGNFAALRASQNADPRVVQAHRRFRHWDSVSVHGWELMEARFDALREPHEPFRFGWIVELDPFDPGSPPVKRTALGRMAHESATLHIARDGHVVVYTGDDDMFEYIYKYVSKERYVPGGRSSAASLLDHGTLYVARFDEDGSGVWLPLVHDAAGPLNAAAGFRDQAEVLIRTRAAADLLGATPMDRPEDIEVHPGNGRVYVACTRNELRMSAVGLREYAGRIVDHSPDAANPRNRNRYGHLIEISEDRGDHTSRRFHWDAWLMGSDSPRGTTTLGSPDNLAFDDAGRLWIVTDGDQPDGSNNGCHVLDRHAGVPRLQRFMLGPVGAEVAGCVFSPGCDTLFLSIQHPGEGGTVDRPVSDWPDGSGNAPRSSVIAIRREDGDVL